MTILKVFNHKRQPKDERDYKFTALMVPKKQTIPPSTLDLRIVSPKLIPNILDQGNLGSCSANACSNVLRYLLRKQKLKEWLPSRLYIYWYSRFLRGTTNEDSGAVLRDVMTAIHTFGACDENLLPYNVNKFKLRPSNKCVRAGTPHGRDFKYMALETNLVSIKQCINLGFPIVFGMDVFESFETESVMKTGIVPMPNESIEECLGGHAVAMFGYDDIKKCFIVMNSWGESWGDKGFFYLPYDYLKYMFDLWTMKFFD